METDSTERVLIETLPASDFQLLESVYEGFVPPGNSIVIVARQRGEIVGRIFLMSPTHIEGPWVRNDLRGHILGKRLMDAAAEKAQELGITKLFAYAADEQLAGYLQRLGYDKEPFTVWSKEL